MVEVVEAMAITEWRPGEYEAREALDRSFRQATDERRDGCAMVFWDGEWTCWSWQFRCVCNLAIGAGDHQDSDAARTMADANRDHELTKPWKHSPSCPVLS